MFDSTSQKTKYLEYCEGKYNENTIVFIERIFTYALPVEQRYGVDLSEFNRKQIISLLKKFDYRSRETLTTICSYLSTYYCWCKDNNYLQYSTVNEYDLTLANEYIKIVLPEKLLSNKYISRSIFLSYLPNILDATDRFMVYALWSGLTAEEMKMLKIEDLNVELKQVSLFTGRVKDVDDMFVLMMQEADAMQYYNKDGDNSQRRDYYDYIQTGYVFKPQVQGRVADDQPISSAVVTRKIGNVKAQVKNSLLSISMLHYNGLMDYLKRKLAQDNITLRQAFEKTKDKGEMARKIQSHIDDFGALNVTARMLKKKIIDYIDNFE